VVYLENPTLLARVLEGYKRYLAYDNGSAVWLFSRYTPCKSLRVLSTNPTDFSIGNLIVNIGGDLAGARADNGDYARAIALSLDVYKDYTNVYEQDKAWPNLWYTANIRGIEVWYLLPGETSDYRGIWDTSDGSLGSGRIVYYNISVGSVANATRVMSDGNLVYTQEFILEPGAPYVKVILRVRNNTTENMSDVRVTLAFDNMDWWLYQVVYLPGVGYFNASTSGTEINSGEREYHFAYSWEGVWRRITDDSGRGWWPSIVYSNRPLGSNPALLVLVQGDYEVHFWGYGNLQAPRKDLYGMPAFTDWYYRWLKYEVVIGDLAAGEARTVEVRIVPMASYAPGFEGLVLDMARHMESLAGRDWSFALNTGTGAFSGLALAYPRLDDPGRAFVERVINSTGRVMEGWGWRVSTRRLADYTLALARLYQATASPSLLRLAEEAARALLAAQVRDPADPRDGGFLDEPPPFGVGVYLDVGAEAARALLALHGITGSKAYLEAVEYWLGHWFRESPRGGGWYYFRCQPPQGGGGKCLGRLEDEPTYALGYLLQALAPYKPTSSLALEAASIIWGRLTGEYWVATLRGAGEANVEALSAASAGLRALLDAQASLLGAGLEYARGGIPRGIRVSGALELELGPARRGECPVIIVVYLPNATPTSVAIAGSEAAQLHGLDSLSRAAGSAYYWSKPYSLLYIKAAGAGPVRVAYKPLRGGPPASREAPGRLPPLGAAKVVAEAVAALLLAGAALYTAERMVSGSSRRRRGVSGGAGTARGARV
jgi:hypothetical protein